jgi:hypothetical protein
MVNCCEAVKASVIFSSSPFKLLGFAAVHHASSSPIVGQAAFAVHDALATLAG